MLISVVRIVRVLVNINPMGLDYPFFVIVTIIEFVHISIHHLVSQIFEHILCIRLTIESLLFTISFYGTLSWPTVLLFFFNEYIYSTTSTLRIQTPMLASFTFSSHLVRLFTTFSSVNSIPLFLNVYFILYSMGED